MDGKKESISPDMARISRLMQQLSFAFAQNYDADKAICHFFELINMIGHVKKMSFVNLSITRVNGMYCRKNHGSCTCKDKNNFGKMMYDILEKGGFSNQKYVYGDTFFKTQTDFNDTCDIPVILENTIFFIIREGERISGAVCVELSEGCEWSGNSIAYVVNICDLFTTAVMAAEHMQSLHNSEKTLERVLDSIDAMIYVNDIVTNEILFINEAMKKAFGLTEVTGNRCFEVLQYGIDEMCEFCPVHRLKNIEDPPIVWEEHNTKTKKIYQNTDRLIRWTDGRIVHIQYSVDITETKTAQNELSKTQQTLQAVFNEVPSGIFWKDKNNIFEGVNPQFANIIGLPREKIIGKNNYDIFDRERAEKHVKEDLAILSGKAEIFDYETEFNGQWLHVKKVPMEKSKNRTTAILGVIDDISKIKKGELMLIEKQRLLEKAIEDSQLASKAKGEFLSRMSHEIRTPMNAIIGMTKIARDCEDIPKIKEYLNKITTASDQLLNIINDVLDMSKIEANKLSLVKDDFSIRLILQNISDVLSIKSDEKQQVFKVITDEQIPEYLNGDSIRISQVIMNLLSNAIKFTPECGDITLSSKLLSIKNNTANIQFSIKDSGIGITKEQKERLFKAFEQADGSISRRFGGTGLGLVICKNIVEMMGGTIQVYSDGASYSEFVFDINIEISKNQKTGGSKTSSKISEPAGTHNTGNQFKGKKLLLVEDIDINREIIKALLENTGIEITSAENGLIALEIFKQNPDFDIIFMDIHMPEMNGYDSSVSIRGIGSEKAKNIPIIAMTADVFAEDIQKCMEAQMTGHIGKPIDVDEMFVLMHEYLD